MRLLAVGRMVDRLAGIAQRGLQLARQIGVILDKQYTHGSPLSLGVDADIDDPAVALFEPEHMLAAAHTHIADIARPACTGLGDALGLGFADAARGLFTRIVPAVASARILTAARVLPLQDQGRILDKGTGRRGDGGHSHSQHPEHEAGGSEGRQGLFQGAGHDSGFRRLALNGG
jgi:hypothetical protein